ncbi:hypothetical protein [Polyangium aurulentum]|uniref:hypothetical protein n=1 Tax=Polyangium aurulentum TaxID=2567896 RepID=UPI0010AE3F28|nr:hypothetical protein [Polyangium aurulentum]UQA61241.1 hypothetical protein E8A73_012485 [Polyangium aurulentum]
MRLAFLFAAALAVVAGCGPSAETLEQRRVLAAIDALRDAPAMDVPARRRLLDALDKQEAQSPLARRARDDCAAAYRLLIEGNEATEAVRKALAHPETAPPTTLSDLAAAEEKIKKSGEAMPGCEKAAAELLRAAR